MQPIKETKTGTPGTISINTSTGSTKWGSAKSTACRENSHVYNNEATGIYANKNLFYFDENNPQRKFNKY